MEATGWCRDLAAPNLAQGLSVVRSGEVDVESDGGDGRGDGGGGGGRRRPRMVRPRSLVPASMTALDLYTRECKTMTTYEHAIMVALHVHTVLFHHGGHNATRKAFVSI